MIHAKKFLLNHNQLLWPANADFCAGFLATMKELRFRGGKCCAINFELLLNNLLNIIRKVQSTRGMILLVRRASSLGFAVIRLIYAL
jgi:hypothetical protein